MDLLSIVGIVLAFLAVLGGNFLEGGTLSALLNYPAALIVLGGTFAAGALQTSGNVFKRAMNNLYLVFFSSLKNRLRDLGDLRGVSNKDRYHVVSEIFGGIKEVKCQRSESVYLDLFREPSYNFADTQSLFQTINQVPKYAIEALAFGGLIGIILFLMIFQIGDQKHTLDLILPTVGLYAFSAYRLQPAINFLYQGFASFTYGYTILDCVYADLNVINSSLNKDDSKCSIVPKKSISLKNINYRFPGSNFYTIKNLSCDIEIGSVVGIIGASGAGKTTLIDILLGLLTPNSGQLFVDDKLINNECKLSVGYVPQDIFLLNATISENIAFGVPPNEIDHNSVMSAARLANIYDFITVDLPEKFNTQVGERGVRLSGGQRQRIGIARALYSNPSILILDEATSALDLITERQIMKSINQLAVDKTIVIVAHRLSTIQSANKVILLKNGSVEATGLFEEVMARNLDLSSFAS